MERYISVDAGKFGTKVAEYLKEKDTVRVFQFRTKIGAGDFRDDAIENDTFIIGVKDKVFKVGNGARGDGAELETSKQSIVHKNCTMAAVAKLVSDNEVDTVNLAVGLPAKEWAVVSKREDYKDFMFPSSTIEVKIKECKIFLDGDVNKQIDDFIHEIKTQNLKIEIENLKRQQKVLEGKGEVEESIKLAIKLSQLMQQLNNGKRG